MKISLIMLALILVAAPAALAENIELPADPPAAREITLEEMWRLGGDDEDVLLGVIIGGKIDSEGNTYLVDRQLSQVLVIGPDGDLVATLGREGDGPGELRNPHSMILMENGGIGVIQGFPGRVITILANGDPGGAIDIGEAAEEGGFSILLDLARCGDRLVGVYGRATMDMEQAKVKTTNTFAIMDLEGAKLAGLGTHTIEMELLKQLFDEAAHFSEFSVWAAGGDRIYTSTAQDAYAIRVRDLEGNVIGEYARPFELRKRSDEDKEDIAGGGLNFRVAGEEINIENRYLDHDPPIDDLKVAGDGRLFVRTCRDVRKLLPDGTAARYDVLSPEGELLEQLSLLVPEYDRDNDQLVFLDGSHFLLIRNIDQAQAAMFAGLPGAENEDDLGDAEPLEVVLYRVP